MRLDQNQILGNINVLKSPVRAVFYFLLRYSVSVKDLIKMYSISHY